ncbi:exodeoxyribonuclease VII large subunit [Bombilactobacillus folatiphilus]|uniref:Exodeoxyribonuclease 7 large subunit n=1 Tax=Bombilactobacillus folatiphilus TaxID=2923362 RepID=A0ABY4P7Q5_9LACO|nr:exodeoxyribonuclease VII large subunit [Bombilactobacillus folatiphilus]UQS81626.1 exodeoxyribonuclease VII large subunit [Bombilactobacillus folatiphilus]
MSEPEYLTVSALTKYLKRKFDLDPYLNRRVYLTGEISNFRLRPRHQYFSLKDEHAKISAIMFQSAFQKLKFRPEEGMKVLVCGRVSIYEPSGQYQIYIDQMEPNGIGALYQAFEQLKKKLQAEGVFDLPKRDIPQFPKRIAVITSPSGAVIRDIITTVQRRYPIVQLVLFPAQVQGVQAADSLVNCLKQVNQQGNFDTIIIGRGGGSIEDLWPFNEEKVARAIVASQIPVISSVGHETDTTIADYVADLRAPTPTAAAELATPVLDEVISGLQQLRLILYKATKSILDHKQQLLLNCQQSYLFQNPQTLYQEYLQQVDQLTNNLDNVVVNQLKDQAQELSLLKQNLVYQKPQLTFQDQQLADLGERLRIYYQNVILQNQQQVQHLMNTLDDLSPLKTLRRGYGVVKKQQQLVSSVRMVQPRDQIQIQVADGVIQAIVHEVKEEQNGGKEA